MSEVVLHPDPQLFPVGTTVKVKVLALPERGVPLAGEPSGATVTQPVVDASGVLTVRGLAEETAYIGWASVGGADSYVRFSTMLATGGGVFTPNIAQALARRSGVLPGPPVSSPNLLFEQEVKQGGASGFTFTVAHRIAFPCSNLQVVYPGWLFSNELAGKEKGIPHSLAPVVTLEKNKSGERFKLTFGTGGAPLLEAFGVLVSQPLAFNCVPGDEIVIRTFVNPGNEQFYPGSMACFKYPGFEPAVVVGVHEGNTTENATEPTIKNENPFCNPILVGQPYEPQRTVFSLGDSITLGFHSKSASEPDFNYSWLTTALKAEIGCVRVAGSGIQAAHCLSLFRWATLCGPCNNAVIMLGTNDINEGHGIATVKEQLAALYAQMKGLGKHVIAATVPPHTTSTDAWATAVNQTPTAHEAERLALNEWLRAGPPNVDATWDTAGPIEVNAAGSLAVGGGRWLASGEASTFDGTHPSKAGAARMAEAVNLGALVAG